MVYIIRFIPCQVMKYDDYKELGTETAVKVWLVQGTRALVQQETVNLFLYQIPLSRTHVWSVDFCGFYEAIHDWELVKHDLFIAYNSIMCVCVYWLVIRW